MREPENWVLRVSAGGENRWFVEGDLPVSVGEGSDCDVHLHGMEGSVQIGVIDGAFFVHPGKHAFGFKLDEESIVGSRWLEDGVTISQGGISAVCTLVNDCLTMRTEARMHGVNEELLDLEDLARKAGKTEAVEIAPIAFHPKAADKSFNIGLRPNRSALLIGGAFGMLAVLAWFAFTAKSVELVIEPTAEELALPGTVFKLQMGGRYLLRSGFHNVSAELMGYYPIEEVIEVGQLPSQTVLLEFVPLPGLIAFSTEQNIGADVHVDDIFIGRTPLVDVEIAPGRHRIEYVAERYLSEVREFDVLGKHERQTLSASLTPSWAPVTISSAPAGAEVLVNEISFGTTPMILELGAGERKLEVQLGGYNTWQNSIVVLADEPMTIPEISLVQADGRVELVSNPSGASVSINGVFQGQTPLALRLRPGQIHMLGLTRPGYETEARELSVSVDSEQSVVIDLMPQFGMVEVLSSPTSAQIYVDGELRGVTPVELQLNAVSHEIEIRLDGFVPQLTSITPRPGFPQKWDTALEELNSETGSGYSRVIQTHLGQELRLVLPGEFIMGSSRREQGRRSNEALRAVKLNNAFYLGVKEVSNAEFQAFQSNHDSGSYAGTPLNGADQPVVRVSWEEVAQFMNWLSIEAGLQPVYEKVDDGRWEAIRPLRSGYRLPTEAEWAWAARLSAQEEPLIYPWGQSLPPPDRSGNYADVSAAGLLPTTLITYNDGFEGSAPSGGFEANTLGIFDIGGNVSEWTQDYYEITRSKTEEVVEDPLGPESGRFHAIRGSSWRSVTVTDLRLAYRNYSVEGDEKIGFRIARNLE